MASNYKIIMVVGVIERDGGTLYCSIFYYGPDGYMGKHRKLMPTELERCIWGFGDGSTMPVFDTPLGKIGGAICWENYMPLYRVTLYSKGSLTRRFLCHRSLGKVLVEPDFTKELIHYVNIDLSQIARGKMDLDTVGHYSRPDVFQLTVNEKPLKTVIRH
ncbi:hydrolase, carbon-nitrogen family [Ostertagia ostertagi]